ncbi:hypothetical protein NA57DRAFT_50342, partial [Rhizodiscina lignyota]
SHPLHPATVHFPITLLFLSYALDITQQFPFLTTFPIVGPFLRDINPPKTSYYLLSVGLLSAIPATLTGGMELFYMMQRQDLFNKLLYMALIHAAVNDFCIMGSAYSLWTRRSTKGYEPDVGLVIMSALFGFFMMGAASLGGQLVFDHGVGVVAMNRRNRDEKEK